jgi:hypothetical protein
MGIKSKIESGVGSGLMYVVFFLHLFLVLIYLGIWTIVPSFVYVFSNWIHLVMGLYLVLRFRPFQSTVEFHDYDRILICSAGVFILQALLATTLLNSSLGKQITASLQPWQTWLRRLPFFQEISGVSGSNSTKSIGVDKGPDPNSATTSFVDAAKYSMGT